MCNSAYDLKNDFKDLTYDEYGDFVYYWHYKVPQKVIRVHSSPLKSMEKSLGYIFEK